MSDFPKGGDVAATRLWLDKKGFNDNFVGWEADAILGQEKPSIFDEISGAEGEKLWSFLNTARTDAGGQPAVRSVKFFVRFIFREKSHLMPLELPVSVEPTLKADVTKAISSLAVADPCSYNNFILENQLSEIIVSTATIVENEILSFYSPERIEPVSSGSWSSALLKQLKVNIVDQSMDDFLKSFNMVNDGQWSERAAQLVETLKDVDHDFLTEYSVTELDKQNQLRNSALHCHPLTKALFLMEKYASCEALVDSFIVHLFSALGFNDGMLSVVPQFKMNLHFGGGYDRESIPDFLIMDILSYLKMVIVEDKNWSLGRYNSFPRLFAEIIAVFATNQQLKEQQSKRARTDETTANNNLSAEDMFVLGVRVNGSVFHFHGVGRSPEVLKSMETLQVASCATSTIRLGGESGFDFLKKVERKQIIYILDKFLDSIVNLGRNATRQNPK